MYHNRLGPSLLLRHAGTLLLTLGAAATAEAQVGVLQGVVSGVPIGTVLAVLKGEAQAAEIKVGAEGRFSVALGTGVYTVKCPNGNAPKLVVLNGSASTNINCK